LLSAPAHEPHYPWGAAPRPGRPESTARSYCRACAAPLPPATAPAARRPATALSAAPQRTPAPRRQLASVLQAQAHHTITVVAGTASGTRNLSFSASWRQLEPPNSAAAPARETAATQPETGLTAAANTVTLQVKEGGKEQEPRHRWVQQDPNNSPTACAAGNLAPEANLPSLPHRYCRRRTGADRGCSQQMAVSSASGGIYPLSRTSGASRAMPTGRPCPRAPSAWRCTTPRARSPRQTPRRPRKPANAPSRDMVRWWASYPPYPPRQRLK
jgi:hypothetical protein